MLESLREKRNLALTYKNIIPLRESLQRLQNLSPQSLEQKSIDCGDFIRINLPNLSPKDKNIIEEIAKDLIPWRKGPFCVGDLTIQSEWDSAIKYNLIAPYLDLENKILGDVGCNNGYYMFRALAKNPQKIIGFDPMPLCKLQFDFISHFVSEKSLLFELLGIEDLPFYPQKFDVMLCLGVLYHRKDPLGAIKIIFDLLKPKGEAVFDSLIIEREEEIALCPKGSYAKMSNVYFIPTLRTFKNWLTRCGFRDIMLISTLKTTPKEQRKTMWGTQESLEDFLNPKDSSLTLEGYPAPVRAYIKAKKP